MMLREVQSEQVQIRAIFDIEMVSSGILRFSLAKRSKFDILATNQNQGGKCICRPRISRLVRKKARFTEGSLSFGRAY